MFDVISRFLTPIVPDTLLDDLRWWHKGTTDNSQEIRAIPDIAAQPVDTLTTDVEHPITNLRTIEQLQEQIRQDRAGENARVAARIEATLEDLFFDCAAPYSQLLLLAHLLEVEHKPVQARDLWVVVRRILNALNERGLEPLGAIGEVCGFDPGLHEPIASDLQLAPAALIQIRQPGMTHNGHCIKHASVIPFTPNLDDA